MDDCFNVAIGISLKSVAYQGRKLRRINMVQNFGKSDLFVFSRTLTKTGARWLLYFEVEL